MRLSLEEKDDMIKVLEEKVVMLAASTEIFFNVSKELTFLKPNLLDMMVAF